MTGGNKITQHVSSSDTTHLHYCRVLRMPVDVTGFSKLMRRLRGLSILTDAAGVLSFAEWSLDVAIDTVWEGYTSFI